MKDSAAVQATQQAIQKAEDGQELRCPGWKVTAAGYLEAFARITPQFTAEDVIEASADIVPQPKEKRAWGQIFQQASRRGLIVRIGYVPTKGIQSHMRPTTLWNSKISL